MLDTIVQGDCMEIMPTLPDKSVDMILCDLPYGKTAAAWDKIIPIDALWRQYKRLIKPRGAIALTAVQPFTSLLVTSNLKWYRHNWVWLKERGTGFQRCAVRPLQQHEDVIIFGREATNYTPQKVALLETYIRKGRIKYSVSSPLNYDDGRIHVYTHRSPTSLLCFPRDNTLANIHPTQKPVALFDYLIRTYTQPGQVVLDNCSGSGTTAIAAYLSDRHFICIEKDAEYWRKSNERLARERAKIRAWAIPGLDEVAE